MVAPTTTGWWGSSQSLSHQNPLPVVAKVLVFNEPSADQAAKYGLTNALGFWALLQHFLQLEMNHQFTSIHKITSTYQKRHNLEIEYLQRPMFNMTMNVIQLKMGIEGALATIVLSIPKEQTHPMGWEFIANLVIVADLAIDLEQKFKKGKKMLTPNQTPEDKAEWDVRARRGGTAPPPTTGVALGPTENTGRQRCTTLTNTASGSSGGGATPKTPEQLAFGGNLDHSSDNSDSDSSDNEGESHKKKLTSNQLLRKYMKAMIAD